MTPTEELIIEVLIARTRTGETLWTFDSKLTPQLKSLESKNLITFMHGIVQNTVRASLTGEALQKYIVDSTYVTPNDKELVRIVNDVVRAIDPDIAPTVRALRDAQSSLRYLLPKVKS